MGIVKPAVAYPLNRKEFGIHSVSARSRSTGIMLGEAAIVGDGLVSLEASSIDLIGGSSYYARATEITGIDSNATFNLRTFPDWVWPVLAGATVSTTAASATLGTVGTIVNDKNTSVVAATGILSATLESGLAADLKSQYYYVVAVDATTVDVYAASDFQFKRGTDLYYDSDVQKITTTPLTIVQDTAVSIPGTGVELTGGAGVIAMVAGDVAFFQSAPPHNGISDIKIGQSGIVIPEVELYIVGKERASGEQAMVHAFKAQSVSGMSFPFSQADFAASDITMKLLIDDAEDAIAEFRFVDGIL